MAWWRAATNPIPNSDLNLNPNPDPNPESKPKPKPNSKPKPNPNPNPAQVACGDWAGRAARLDEAARSGLAAAVRHTGLAPQASRQGPMQVCYSRVRALPWTGGGGARARGCDLHERSDLEGASARRDGPGGACPRP